MKKFCLSFLLFLLACSVFSQNPSDRVKVYLDCTKEWLCDFDYVRSEIKLVDFVRDRFVADVHILVNAQSSSSGGMQAQLNLLGQKRFGGINDTLVYFNEPTSTEDDQRKRLVQYVKLGLARYLSRTSYASQLQISFDGNDDSTSSTAPTRDRWKAWVFQFGANGSMNGDQNYRSNAFNGYLSADKETEKWKINLSTSLDRSVDIVKDPGGDLRFERKGYSSNLQIARSINSHWSYGLNAAYQNSLFSNLKAAYALRPKIEYSLFPYSRFNSQRIVIQYVAGPVYNHYYDSTVYFKKQESQVKQNLNAIASFTQPWGSINMGIFYSSYFSDFSKNSLTFDGAVSWKVAKGLMFAVWGNYGLIHNQIALRKGAASRDDVLKQNRELRSSFQYNFGIGFSYRFGSILNNIVNPRFRGLSYSINL